MNYLISYPRSGNTMTRYILELITKRPTNGICGKVNPKDVLQKPLIHKDRDDYVLHKRHDFQGVSDKDFVFFVIRDPFEAVIRHNEKPRGVSETQMRGYLDSWFSLLEQFHNHDNGIVLYYDELQKIASRDSLNIYPDAQSRGKDWHKAKLTKDVYNRLLEYIKTEWKELYNIYL